MWGGYGDFTFPYITCASTIGCDLLQIIQECHYKGYIFWYDYQQLSQTKQDNVVGWADKVLEFKYIYIL
jgi:hypothetical protein